jgi:triacylglycerol lipase
MFDRDGGRHDDEDEHAPRVSGRRRLPDAARALPEAAWSVARSAGSVARGAGSVARGAGSVARTVGAPGGLRGLAVESAWCVAHVLAYPIPVRRGTPGAPHEHRTEDLPLDRRSRMIRDLTTPNTPVLVLHGALDHRGAVAALDRALRRRGSGVLHAIDYGTLCTTGDLRLAAHELREQVQRVRELTGADTVRLVGYSLGGVIARYYVQRLDGAEAVDTLVTVGSPHGGSRAAHLWPTALARQVTPGSDVLTELAEPAPDCHTRFLVVAGRMDQLVMPARNGRVEHPDLWVETLELPDTGHLSLTVHPEAVRWVSTRLVAMSDDRDPMSGAARRGARPLSAVPGVTGRAPLTVR